MDRPSASPESDIRKLTARLDALESRFSALETAFVAVGKPPEPPCPVDPAGDAAAVAEPALAEPAEVPWGESLPLVGRTLMVLAGAFVIRAITEAGILPQLAGAGLGILYALVWTAMADRAAAAGRRMSAAMHGLATAVIAFPLLWEATVKFGFLSPEASALGWVIVTLPGLIVAARQRLSSLAWMIALGALATSLVLAVGTKMVVLFSACLLLLGGATLWLGFVRGWQTLGWLVAILVDLTMILLTVIVLSGDAEQVDRIVRPASLVWLQLSLIVVYLGSFTARTLAVGRNARLTEISQAIAALLIGLLGAVAVTRSASLNSLPLAIVSLLLAAVCYGASFTLHGTGSAKRQNFLFYTTVGLLAGLVACDALSQKGQVQVVAFSMAGLLTAALGAYRGRVTLAVHGAVFVVAAALMSGLLWYSVIVLGLGNPQLHPPLAPAAVMALVVAGIVGSLSSKRHGRTWGFFAPVPKAVTLAIFALGVAAIVVWAASKSLPAQPTAQIDPAALAALRTAVFAVGALALAWLSGTPRWVEAGLLVYPFLVAGGLKLVLEDLRVGRPATLAISLALYGGAMIAAPYVLRRAKQRAGPES